MCVYCLSGFFTQHYFEFAHIVVWWETFHSHSCLVFNCVCMSQFIQPLCYPSIGIRVIFHLELLQVVLLTHVHVS